MRALLAGPLTVLGMAVLLFSLPVSLPVTLAWRAWQDWRRRSRTEPFTCARCGHVLGAAAMRAAEAAHVTALGAMQRRHPNSRVHLARCVDARCTRCGAAYAWDRWQHLLRPVEDSA